MPNDLVLYVAAFALAYLMGSTPNAVIVSRLFFSVDVRELGTENPGASNLFRQVSPVAGVAVGLADMLKAFIPVIIADRVLGLGPVGGTLAAVGALWGHQFSIWLRFRGGAGLASAIGGVAGLMLGPFAFATLVGAPMVLFSRNMGWSGGLTIFAVFFAAGLSLWTAAPFPAALALDRPEYLYGGMLTALLFALPYWLRLLGGLLASRGGSAAPGDASTTEDQT